MKSKEEILKKMPISKIWGIGKNISQFLIKNKVQTAHEFINLNDNWIKKTMSITMWKTKQELKGKNQFLLENPSGFFTSNKKW